MAAARRRWGTIGEGCVCVDVNSLRLAIIVDIALFAGFDRSEPHREHHAERADQHETHADKAALQVLDGDLVADRFLDEGIELVLRRRRHGKGGGEEGSPGVGCEGAFGAGADAAGSEQSEQWKHAAQPGSGWRQRRQSGPRRRTWCGGGSRRGRGGWRGLRSRAVQTDALRDRRASASPAHSVCAAQHAPLPQRRALRATRVHVCA